MKYLGEVKLAGLESGQSEVARKSITHWFPVSQCFWNFCVCIETAINLAPVGRSSQTCV